jgi:hypothetical protein
MVIDLGHSEFLDGHWTFSFSMAALARHSPAKRRMKAAELVNSETPEPSFAFSVKNS